MPVPDTAASGGEALCAGAGAGDAARVRALLADGVDPEARGDADVPALYHAVGCGHAEAAAVLLDGGADPNTRIHPDNPDTVLHWAARRGDAPMLLRLLLDRGADPTAPDAYGLTPLHEAVGRFPPAACCAVLVEAGADVGAKDREGRTPLHVAAHRGANDAVRALLAAGADPRAPDRDGRMPLHHAARHGHDNLAAFLRKAARQALRYDDELPAPREPAPAGGRMPKGF